MESSKQASMHIEKDVSDVDIELCAPVEPGETAEAIPTTASRARLLQQKFALLRWLQRFETYLDRTCAIEVQGIDPIPEEKKQPPSTWNMFWIWWSLNIHVGVLPLGVLGPQMGLSVQQSTAAAIAGVALGALCTAFAATLGSRLGMRQIAIARYSFGYYGAKLCSVLNIVVGGGFYVVNLVVAGQVLSAVSDSNMTITVGIVVVAILSYVISVFGHRMFHTWSKFSWILTTILLCILMAQAAPYISLSTPELDERPTSNHTGAFLTFLAISFANTATWSSCVSDYYCNFLSSTPRWKVYTLTYFGLVISISSATIVGICLGSIAAFSDAQSFVDAYEAGGLGALIYEIYHPTAFAKFALIMLTFSILSVNIAQLYSTGLSTQLLGDIFHAVPRFIWSLIYLIVVTVLSIAGQENLSTILANFVSLLGYWAVSFVVVLLFEDIIFRRNKGYDIQAWNQPARLPLGISAVLALITGYCGGGIPGMSQTSFVGPIAKMLSINGGDVGIYLSAAVTSIVYLPARYIENRITGR